MPVRRLSVGLICAVHSTPVSPSRNELRVDSGSCAAALAICGQAAAASKANVAARCPALLSAAGHCSSPLLVGCPAPISAGFPLPEIGSSTIPSGLSGPRVEQRRGWLDRTRCFVVVIERQLGQLVVDDQREFGRQVEDRAGSAPRRRRRWRAVSPHVAGEQAAVDRAVGAEHGEISLDHECVAHRDAGHWAAFAGQLAVDDQLDRSQAQRPRRRRQVDNVGEEARRTSSVPVFWISTASVGWTMMFAALITPSGPLHRGGRIEVVLIAGILRVGRQLVEDVAARDMDPVGEDLEIAAEACRCRSARAIEPVAASSSNVPVVKPTVVVCAHSGESHVADDPDRAFAGLGVAVVGAEFIFGDSLRRPMRRR